jgi:hypothetical protein
MTTSFILAPLSVFLLVNLAPPDAARPEEAAILVAATPVSRELPEACPFVVRVTLKNPGVHNIDTTLDVHDLVALDEATSLQLTASDGQVHRVFYTGKPQANRYSLPVKQFIMAGTVVEFDRVFMPISWGRRQGAYSYEFIPPDDYSAKVVVAYRSEHVVSSDPFALRLTNPTGNDKAARQIVSVEIAAFMCGGEPLSQADGRKRVVLEQLLNDHPGSHYAEWISFWKLYHYGPIEDALSHARAYRDFPLSDNLMLHMAEGLFENAGKYDRATYDRVRELVDELQKLFADGDTKARADELREKLMHKP